MTYILFPSHVRSQTDGQWHYISAPVLAQLYGVDYNKCKVVYKDTRGYKKQEGDIELHVSFRGDYWLPTN